MLTLSMQQNSGRLDRGASVGHLHELGYSTAEHPMPIRKVQSYHANLGMMPGHTTPYSAPLVVRVGAHVLRGSGDMHSSNDRIRNLQSEVRQLTYELSRDSQPSMLGPWTTLFLYAAIATNLVMAGRVFSNRFLHYMKQELTTRKVTARVVGRYARQATKTAQTGVSAVLRRSTSKQGSAATKALSFDTVYRNKNRDGFVAALWSSPFVVLAYLTSGIAVESEVAPPSSISGTDPPALSSPSAMREISSGSSQMLLLRVGES